MSVLPKSALAHHIAVLGKTGSGKTSVVKAAVIEPALRAEERVCVIDPTGAWWGLRLLADGRSKGFPAYVFGGRQGDYPLLGNHGEAMADVIGTTNTPAILDTSGMKIGERVRFFTDFADAILRKNDGPLRLVIDEAHVFMPQSGTRGGGPVPDMLHAGNNLISLGRSRGLRIVLISQRAAKLHKDSLTQVETMIACRLLAPQDRKAFREWIVDQADEADGNDIIASLPKLRDGEAWVWAPEADFLKRIQFPPPLTYDSSAAPSKATAARKLSPIDLDVLRSRLAKVDAEVAANDPSKLRAEIAKLKTEVQTLSASKPVAPPADPDAERRVFERAAKKLRASMKRELNKKLREGLKAMRRHAAEAVERIDDELREIDAKDVEINAEFAPAGHSFGAARAAIANAPRPAPSLPPQSPSRAKPAATIGDGSDHPLRAERRPLAALAGVHPGGMTEAQWAVSAGLKRSGGTWSTYVSRLRIAGRIAEIGGLYYASESGIADLGGIVSPMPPPGHELVAFWAGKIAGAGPMLGQLASVYPRWLTRDELAAALNLAATGGTFSTYMSRLRGPSLIEEDKVGGRLRAAATLMERAA